MLIEDMLDVNGEAIVRVNFAPVEKLPIAVLSVENEQDRQLPPVDCAAEVRRRHAAMIET